MVKVTTVPPQRHFIADVSRQALLAPREDAGAATGEKVDQRCESQLLRAVVIAGIFFHLRWLVTIVIRRTKMVGDHSDQQN